MKKDRIEWMEKNISSAVRLTGSGWRVATGRVGYNEGSFDAPTLREAIDKAMEASKCE